MPKMTSAVNLSWSILIPSVLTPSFFNCSTMNLPICSFPTLVIIADFKPNLAAPAAILVGEPPIYF